MTDLGTLGQSEARGINASGQVVGRFDTFGGEHAFITAPNGAGMTDLGTLGGARSLAFGINASGQVVGLSSTLEWSARAFLTGPNGVGMSDLNDLIGPGVLGTDEYLGVAYGINDAGQIIANSSYELASLLSPVPEAETWALMLSGLGLVGLSRRLSKA